MSTIQLHLIALVGVPLITVLVAYFARWVAGFFFNLREAEIVGLTCSIAWMIGNGYRYNSAYYGVLGLIGWAVGIYLLHKLWRANRAAGVAQNG